jgi:uncharacterized protein YndB with AHSA1/START domain
MTDGMGVVTRQDDRATVRFERHLDAAIGDVWAALTTPAGLASWLAPATVDLTEGGKMAIDFGEEGLAGGPITALDAPTLLEYQWRFPGEPDSVLRFALTPDDEHTVLVLEHRFLPADQAMGYGAGWHAHLDHLEARLAGREPGVWADRFRELVPHYL